MSALFPSMFFIFFKQILAKVNSLFFKITLIEVCVTDLFVRSCWPLRNTPVLCGSFVGGDPTVLFFFHVYIEKEWPLPWQCLLCASHRTGPTRGMCDNLNAGLSFFLYSNLYMHARAACEAVLGRQCTYDRLNGSPALGRGFVGVWQKDSIKYFRWFKGLASFFSGVYGLHRIFTDVVMFLIILSEGLILPLNCYHISTDTVRRSTLHSAYSARGKECDVYTLECRSCYA